MTEKVETGKKDDWGHIIYEKVPIKNVMGEEIKVREIAARPSKTALCDFLQLRPASYERYKKSEETGEILREAEELIKDWATGELLKRDDKTVKGVMYYLDNAFGWADKKEVSLGAETAEKIQALSLAEKMAVIASIHD